MAVPDTIDKYKIEKLVASGGMGAVYKGMHPTLKRPVILKKLTLRGNASFAERFKREARILLDFRNDYIVDVHDHFKKGATHYIVMEYVDGMSLQDLLNEHRYLDNPTAAFILLRTAKGLRYAHAKKVVHRDIKPANILLSNRGEVKLADFGIATSRSEESEEETLTKEGMTLGTPSYMAPEQFDSSRSVDKRADIYSLGVMLYEMLTGKKPFPGGFSPELVFAIKQGKYKHPKKLNPAVHPLLLRILKKLMQPNMDKRPKDLSEIIAPLEKYLAQFEPLKLRSRLIALVKGTEAPLVEPKINPALMKKIFLFSGIGLAAISGILFLIFSGLPLRVFASRHFGELSMSLDLSGFPGELSRASIETTLFVDDNSAIPEAEQQPLFVPPLWGEEKVFNALPMVLPTGQYRLKATVNDKVFWQAIYVQPWHRASDGVNYLLEYPTPVPQEIRVLPDFRDALSGRGLGTRAVLEINRGGGYETLGPNQTLLSGVVHKLRVSAQGYYSQVFDLFIRPEQDSLSLSAAMVPLAGTLRIQSPEGIFEWKVNGSEIVTTVSAGVLVTTDIREDTSNSYSLLPGDYEVSVKYRGQEINKNISISTGENTFVIVELRDDDLRFLD